MVLWWGESILHWKTWNRIILISAVASCCHNTCYPGGQMSLLTQSPRRFPQRAFPSSVPGVACVLLVCESQISSFASPQSPSHWRAMSESAELTLWRSKITVLVSAMNLSAQASQCHLSCPSTPRSQEAHFPIMGSNILPESKCSNKGSPLLSLTLRPDEIQKPPSTISTERECSFGDLPSEGRQGGISSSTH